MGTLTGGPVPQLLPGDIVQVIDGESGYSGCLAIVEAIRVWGVTADIPVRRGAVVPVRLTSGQFMRIGPAVATTPEIQKARREYLDTLTTAASTVLAGSVDGPSDSWIMEVAGLPDGRPCDYDGLYLEDFDFEAEHGTGLITVTADADRAKKFDSPKAAMDFRDTVPKCRPRRDDGEANKPLTGTNWIIKRAGA